MARKRGRQGRKSHKQARVAAPAKRAAPISFSRRSWLLTAGATVAAASGASVLHAWDVQTRELHDLEVIGNGVPVVVQVHDTSCPTCRRLKSVMSAVMDDKDDVTYRIADLSTPDGRDMAQRYRVPKVTLLFFDARGEHRYTHTGLESAERIETIVDDVLSEMRRDGATGAS